MFDNIKTGDVTHEVTFNSVAGTLVKSSSESKFIQFHMDSKLADRFFDAETPHRYQEYEYPYTKTKIDILQVMLCGDKQFLVEYIDITEPEKEK